MNVFEDLVAELQQENLLEMTVIDIENGMLPPDAELNGLDADVVPHDSFDLDAPGFEPSAPDDTPVKTNGRKKALVNDEAYGDVDRGLASRAGVNGNSAGIGSEDDFAIVADLAGGDLDAGPRSKKPDNGKEFYQKRAVGEVSNLQMVEHVLTGVEREYLKVVPNVFDDFNVKKSLHAFLHVTEDENSSAHQEAESTLMNETEAWCTALATRDRGIPVSSLRQYCENSRPALSSQALLALARFYRNLPYSESVRSKFDFVITRLFSRPAEHERRVCLFTRVEALKHINTLYKEWSSVSLYAADDNDTNVTLTALSFDDLAAEAEKAESFDELIASDFFGRLRLFKESIAELFYAPNVTSAAIEANIRIGNTYVNLIARERQKMDAETIQSKYGDLHDDTISEGAARTLDLVELLRTVPAAIDTDDVYQEEREDDIKWSDTPVVKTEVVFKTSRDKSVSGLFARLRRNAFEINRWFLAIFIALVLASVGVYVWANFFVREDVATKSVASVNVDSLAIREFVRSAKISGENFYAMMEPTWDVLSKEKKEEVLQKVYQLAREKGCRQVTLLSDKDGKKTAFASATRVDIEP